MSVVAPGRPPLRHGSLQCCWGWLVRQTGVPVCALQSCNRQSRTNSAAGLALATDDGHAFGTEHHPARSHRKSRQHGWQVVEDDRRGGPGPRDVGGADDAAAVGGAHCVLQPAGVGIDAHRGQGAAPPRGRASRPGPKGGGNPRLSRSRCPLTVAPAMDLPVPRPNPAHCSPQPTQPSI